MASLRSWCRVWRARKLISSTIQRKTYCVGILNQPSGSGTITGVEESKEDFKYVEKLLPNPLVPEPPKHDSYPTPSGWSPPAETPPDLPYFVGRTRFHNLPIYMEISGGGNRKFTVIEKVEGDVWALEAELRKLVEELTERNAVTQVDEVCQKVRIKGIFLEEISKYLVEKGF